MLKTKFYITDIKAVDEFVIHPSVSQFFGPSNSALFMEHSYDLPNFRALRVAVKQVLSETLEAHTAIYVVLDNDLLAPSLTQFTKWLEGVDERNPPSGFSAIPVYTGIVNKAGGYSEFTYTDYGMRLFFCFKDSVPSLSGIYTAVSSHLSPSNVLGSHFSKLQISPVSDDLAEFLYNTIDQDTFTAWRAQLQAKWIRSMIRIEPAVCTIERAQAVISNSSSILKGNIGLITRHTVELSYGERGEKFVDLVNALYPDRFVVVFEVSADDRLNKTQWVFTKAETSFNGHILESRLKELSEPPPTNNITFSWDKNTDIEDSVLAGRFSLIRTTIATVGMYKHFFKAGDTVTVSRLNPTELLISVNDAPPKFIDLAMHRLFAPENKSTVLLEQLYDIEAMDFLYDDI